MSVREQESDRAYVRVEAKNFHENFVAQMMREYEELIQRYVGRDDAEWLDRHTSEAITILKTIMRPFITVPGMMYPSLGADVVYKDRMHQAIMQAKSLLTRYQERVEQLVNKLQQRETLSAQERQRLHEELIRLLRIIITLHIVIKEVGNRLLLLMTASAPSTIRPSLVNVMLGYDKL